MHLKEFFYFTKSDRKVILFLLLAVALVAGMMYYMDTDTTTNGLTKDDSLLLRRPAAERMYHADEAIIYDTQEGQRAALFPFDPNTADSTDLLRLGLKPWQVRNIYKYRAAGGVYRRPTDFARLYGLTQKQYRQLEPYIRIGDDYQPASRLVPAELPHERDTILHPVKLKPGERVALNRADTTMLKKVPGIGRYYAREVVWYRERLGGFYSVEQLKEIEGFPAEALPYFTVSEHPIRKLNVNRLTLSQLRRHPYISFYQAKAIADYRRLKGPLSSLSELRLLKDFSEKDLERLSHYVEY